MILSRILAQKDWSKAGFQAKLLRQAFDHHDFTNNDVDSARIDVNDPRALKRSVWKVSGQNSSIVLRVKQGVLAM